MGQFDVNQEKSIHLPNNTGEVNIFQQESLKGGETQNDSFKYVEFTACFYPQNPENSQIILQSLSECQVSKADWDKMNGSLVIPQFLPCNENESSVKLPQNCYDLIVFWCQMDDFIFEGSRKKGEKGEVFKMERLVGSNLAAYREYAYQEGFIPENLRG